MATGELVDWRGKSIDKKVHGGVRAAWFLYFLVFVNFFVHMPTLQNMVAYLHGAMHMGVSDSSTTVTNFIGAMCAFALLGAFLSDSYISCSTTMLLSVPFMILGFGMLALQAHLPSLHPPRCISTESHPSGCNAVDGWRSALLYTALYTITIRERFVRACIPALGADQFDGFFNWFTFCLSIGSIAGLVLIVWIQNSKGWDVAFGLSTLLVLLGWIVAAAGLPFYRNRIPQGSPLTRVTQVFVVAFRNRMLKVPENMEAAQENSCQGVSGPDKSLKFLDKACLNTGRDGAWSVCSAAQVEETKIVLRLLPLFLSAMVAHVPSPLLVAFTVQQGMTTDTRLGRVHVYPGMLFVIPSTFQMLMLVAYDRVLVPLLRRRTGYLSGITHLQRIGIGFLATCVAPAVAAVTERKRKETVASGGQMSLFWLAPQFFLIGVADSTSFVGLLELFNSEAPRGMKSIGVALFWCQFGMASLLGTLLG